MPAPPSWLPDLPVVPKRFADLLDYGARITVSLVAIWAFVEKVAKPYSAWRRRKMSTELREILRPEFDRLERVANCTDRIEMVLTRQSELFRDIDDFITIAKTNVERVDEINLLLDEVFHLDRRVNTERRSEIDELLFELGRRQQDRRRRADEENASEPKKLA